MIEFPHLPIDAARLRDAFGCFPSGVTVLGAMIDGEPVGMAASSFTSVSLDPPLVSVCMQVSSKTWRTLRETTRIGISVLSSSQHRECRQLARAEGDRFDGVDWDVNDDGSIFIAGATVWLNCSLHTVVPAGDHAIVLFRILELWCDAQVDPLVFHGSKFRTLNALPNVG